MALQGDVTPIPEDVVVTMIRIQMKPMNGVDEEVTAVMDVVVLKRR